MSSPSLYTKDLTFEEAEENREAQAVAQIRQKMKTHYSNVPPVRSMPCLTNETIRGLMAEFEKGGRFPLLDALQVLCAASCLFKEEPSVGSIEIPRGGRVVVVGDLHGSMGDLLHILRSNGLPGEGTRYIFNGDLVDRGNNGCEVLILLLALKLSTPDAVHINRGNHEEQTMNILYGFYIECLAKYNRQFFEYCCSLFTWLPLAAVVDQRVLVVHGGLWDGTLDDIRAIPRGPRAELTPEQEAMLTDLMWSDPHDRKKGRQKSPRGTGHIFGADYTKRWLERENLELLIRSHQCKGRTGFFRQHDGLVYTVFSASNYYWTQWLEADAPIVRQAYPNNGSVVVFQDGVHEPFTKSWDPPLLPIDNPVNSAPLQRTGRPFQFSVPLGWLGDPDIKEATLTSIHEALVESRTALRERFESFDPERNGVITLAEWQEAVSSVAVVVDSFPLDTLLLRNEVDPLGRVIYRRFLKRLVVIPSGELLKWHNEVLATMYKKIINGGKEIEAAFDEFNTDKDGVLSHDELIRAMRQLFPKQLLSDAQLEAIVKTIDSDKQGMTRDEFRSCLLEAARRDPKHLQVTWAIDRREERLRAVRSQLCQRTEEEIEQILKKYSGGDNVIFRDDLTAAITEGMGVPVTECFVDDLAEEIGTRRLSIDVPSTLTFSLNIKKVAAALAHSAADRPKEKALEVAIELSQTMLNILYRYRTELKDLLFPDDRSIPVDRFKSTLSALNAIDNYPLTDMQIELLVDMLDTDKDGFIEQVEVQRLMRPLAKVI